MDLATCSVTLMTTEQIQLRVTDDSTCTLRAPTPPKRRPLPPRCANLHMIPSHPGSRGVYRRRFSEMWLIPRLGVSAGRTLTADSDATKHIYPDK